MRVWGGGAPGDSAALADPVSAEWASGDCGGWGIPGGAGCGPGAREAHRVRGGLLGPAWLVPPQMPRNGLHPTQPLRSQASC